MATLEAVLAGKYPAKSHARRVAEHLRANGHDGPGIIYLEAQKTRLIEDNDEAMPFRYMLALPLNRRWALIAGFQATPSLFLFIGMLAS